MTENIPDRLILKNVASRFVLNQFDSLKAARMNSTFAVASEAD